MLLAAMSASAAESTVPAEFIGDWVPIKASCESKTRLRVAPTTVTLVNGTDSQQFGNLDICYSCEGGARYNGEVVWLLPELNSADAVPFTVRFNANEEQGIAVVEIESSSIRSRFLIHDTKLHKCQTM
jgi:hypothetical protein